jgi:serine/threonine protein kinase
MSNVEMYPGEILAGKYEVERVLGRGGMGVVLGVRHMNTGRSVALKIMTLTGMASEEAEARFFREAKIAAMLKSQHAGKVRDCGKLEDGSPFIEMDLLEGRDLSQLLKTRGEMTVEQAVTYVLQASEAVAEAHASGIVHRDLKPANLFLTKGMDGKPCVKVLDFGISKLEAEEGKLTQTDQFFGSPLYMSPEQMQSAKHADGRSDVWSLGVILYELLSGTTPFKAATMMAVGARVFVDAPTPIAGFRPDLPPGLVAVIMQCLEKDPARRWQNVAQLAAALAPFTPADMLPYVDRIAKVRGVEAPASRPTDRLPPEPTPMPGSGLSVRGGLLPTATASALTRPPATARPRSRTAVVVGAGFVIAIAGALYVGARAGAPREEPPRVAAPVPSALPMASVPLPPTADPLPLPVASSPAASADSGASSAPLPATAPTAKPKATTAPKAVPAIAPVKPKKNIYYD